MEKQHRSALSRLREWLASPRDGGGDPTERARNPMAIRPLAVVLNMSGEAIRTLWSLIDALAVDDGIVIIEGDYGGQIYLTIPARLVRRSERELWELAYLLDGWEWDEVEGNGVFFERHPAGSVLEGGMGGGMVGHGLWMHPDLFVDRRKRLPFELADVTALVDDWLQGTDNDLFRVLAQSPRNRRTAARERGRMSAEFRLKSSWGPFRSRATVSVDPDGITLPGAGRLCWQEVEEIRYQGARGQAFLGVVPSDPDAYLHGISSSDRALANRNVRDGLAPIAIPESRLPISTGELIATIDFYRRSESRE